VIAHLRGVLLERGLDQVVVEAGGVGYLVTMTAAGLRALPQVGAEARLHIYAHHTEDRGLQLYGFTDPDERRVFETLLAVQGVGPKVAIAILAGLPVSELVRAISTADVARLTQIRGVGRKIAERMVVELREKIVAVAAAGGSVGAAPAPAPSGVPVGTQGEAWAALVALGYRPAEIEPVLTKLDKELPAEQAVKAALSALRRK
jgi:Holliday junction DNA helicase RuvA